MAPPPVPGDYRPNAISAETLQQRTHQCRRQERHITSGDEGVLVLRVGETSFDASEGSLPAWPLVGYAPDSFQANSRISNDQDFLAGGREGVPDVFDQGQATDLEGQLLAAHPAALATGEDHPRCRVAQEAILAAAVCLVLTTFWRSISTRSVLSALLELRARRFARARSTAMWCSLRAVRQSRSLPVRTSLM